MSVSLSVCVCVCVCVELAQRNTMCFLAPSSELSQDPAPLCEVPSPLLTSAPPLASLGEGQSDPRPPTHNQERSASTNSQSNEPVLTAAMIVLVSRPRQF